MLRRLLGAALAAALLLAVPAAAQAARTLYVSSYTSDRVASFAASPSGDLGRVGGAVVVSNPTGIAMPSDGSHLYAASEDGEVLDLVPDVRGALAEVGRTAVGSCLVDIAVSPDDATLYVAGCDGLDAIAIGPDGTLGAERDTLATGFATHVVVTPGGDRAFFVQPAGPTTTIRSVALQADGSFGAVSAEQTDVAGFATIRASADGRRILVADAVDDVLRPFAIGPDGALAPLPTAPATDIVSFDESADGRRVIAGGDTLTMIERTAGDYVVAATWPLTGQRVRDLATAPGGAAAFAGYTPAADGNTWIQGFSFTSAAGFAPASPELIGSGSLVEHSTLLTPQPAPTADFSATLAGREVTLDASASAAADGSALTYRWDLGDGTVVDDDAPTLSHAYTTPGAKTITLTVADAWGCSAFAGYDGRTASCFGTDDALATRTVAIPVPPAPPAPDTEPVPVDPAPLAPQPSTAPSGTPSASTPVAARCVVPDLQGKRRKAARRALRAAECRLGDVTRRRGSRFPRHVTGQSRKVGSTHPARTTVDVRLA